MTITAQQIREMLDGIKDEIAQVEADAARRTKKLQARAAVFEEMLAELKPAQGDLIAAANGDADADDNPLRAFLSHALADGQPREHAELVRMVEANGKLIRGKAVPGRAVHGVLMGMWQSGIAKKEQGKWVKAQSAPTQ